MPRYKRRLISDINMVPFIDIVLVLLVAFMVASPLMQQGVDVSLPKTQSDALKPNKNDTLIISVKADGSYFLDVGQNQKNAITLKEMISKIEKIRRRSPNIAVLVRGDSNVNYGKIVNAMSGLQQAGITDIGLVTDPRD